MRREFGIPVPEVSVVSDAPEIHFDPSTATRISRYKSLSSSLITLISHLIRMPLLRDLYECRHVSVRASAEGGAGEGLWARVNIPQGRLCALFNGVREYRQESGVTWLYYIQLKCLINVV